MLSDIFPDLAVIVVGPTPTDVARPWEPGALEIKATRPTEELHVTNVVMFCVVPSESIPVAVNCLVWPKTMLGLDGVTVIEITALGMTVSVAWLDVTPDRAAVMTVVPCASVAAFPAVPAMVATSVSEDVQAAVAVMSLVAPSENVPIAANCCVSPRATLGLTGVTAIETTTAGFTVNAAAFEVTPPKTAVMEAVPGPTAVASPCDPAVLLTVAIAASDVVHVAKEVRSWDAPFDRFPAAVNCSVVPWAPDAAAGVTAMDVTPAAVREVVPEIAPKVAVIVVEPVEEGVVDARPAPDMFAAPAFDEVHIT